MDKEKTRKGRRHSLQVSMLGNDVEKLRLAERKEKVINNVDEHSKVVPEDDKKMVRNLSKSRRNSKQGRFSLTFSI